MNDNRKESATYETLKQRQLAEAADTSRAALQYAAERWYNYRPAAEPRNDHGSMGVSHAKPGKHTPSLT